MLIKAGLHELGPGVSAASVRDVREVIDGAYGQLIARKYTHGKNDKVGRVRR